MICKATGLIKVSIATIKTTNQGKIMKTLLMLIKWTILYVFFGIITIPVMIIRELKKWKKSWEALFFLRFFYFCVTMKKNYE